VLVAFHFLFCSFESHPGIAFNLKLFLQLKNCLAVFLESHRRFPQSSSDFLLLKIYLGQHAVYPFLFKTVSDHFAYT